MFLRASPDADAQAIDAKMLQLWAMWRELMAGHIRDLPGQDVGASDLEVLVAYGSNAFRVAGALRPPPIDLVSHPFRRPAPGGNEILAGTHIRYAPGIARNPATEEIAVQGTAATPLAASRLVVETAKLIADLTPAGSEPVLQVASAFVGFNREDHRSWIDFHDGTSNLRSGVDREDVITIKNPPAVPAQDAWTTGGTYLAFIRLSVDMAGWRTLPRTEQEIAVGRMKLTGCPVVSVQVDGSTVPVAGCPIVGTPNVAVGDNQAFYEPPVPGGPIVPASHVQRANQHIGLPLSNPQSFRIFRQGYEFFDPPQLDWPMQLGLNFVSFQDTLDRLFHILVQPQWLGDVNFGGREDRQLPPLVDLLTAHAAGVYLVPPVVAGEAYPGRSIFHA